MLTIAPMTLPEVRAAWGWVRNGLLEVIGRCNERYEPEDVWTAVMAQQAFVWRIVMQNDDYGFVVLRRDNDPDGHALFVWAAWAEPGSLLKLRHEFYERLKEVAHRVGAKRIRFESPRKGWDWFKDHFDPVKTIYEGEV